MAKKNETVDQSGNVVAEGQDAADYVQNQERGAKARQAEEELAVLSKGLTAKDVLEKLAKVTAAKADAFEQKTSDFRRLSAGEEIKGIYLGTVQGPKYKVHAFGIIDPKTKEPMTVRYNGTVVLTKELARGKVGQGVHIKCTGESKTSGGNRLYETSVAWLG